MSLLMQALKKAEQIKQKQSALPSDEVLTLSPKEMAVTTEIVGNEKLIPEQTNIEPAASLLTLSPQLEEKPAEAVFAEADLTQEVGDAVLVVESPPEASRNTLFQDDVVPHRAVSPTSFDTANADNTPGSDPVSVTSASAEPNAGEQKNISRPEMPRMGVEQKQIAEQAEKVLLSEQKKAKSVFSSKVAQGNQRRVRIGIYASLCLLAVAVFAYLYWQNMNVGLNSTILRTPPPLPATTAVLAPDPSVAAKIDVNGESPVIASTSVASQASAINSATEALRSASGTTAAQQNSAPQSNQAPVSSGVKFNANASNTGSEAAASANAAAVSPKVRTSPATPIEDSNAIQIRRNSSGNQVNPGLSSAYQSFIAGDAAAAKSQYQKVLQQEPNNRDALLGMAAIALNQRQAEQAGAFYGRLLELDPSDPDAIAGLTSLQQGDPVQSESRLKKSLSQNPQAGAVLFALGNLYAQQSRWSDAQQIYFRAYTATPGSADYAFNLAVSLDKLNQVKLAREYYQRALTLGQNSSGNFSRSEVQKRINELEAITQQ